MKPISEETRNNILSLLDNGLSSRKITAQLGVSRATIDRIREKSRTDIQKSCGGRPAKLNATDRCTIATITSDQARQIMLSSSPVAKGCQQYRSQCPDSMPCLKKSWVKGSNKEEKATTFAKTCPPTAWLCNKIQGILFFISEVFITWIMIQLLFPY